MRPPQPSWISIATSQQAELDAYARMNPGWQMLSHASLPSVFPESFRRKVDSGILIAAPTSSGGTYLVCNALRADFRTRKIDQEPFAVIYHSTGAAASGMFLHHGDWRERTQPAPAGFWEHIMESGVGDYFLANPPSGQTSGTLDQLTTDHRDAFNTAVRYLRGGE